MSTILDALRKVEEENRTRNADMRARLLTTPQRFDLRPPRRQRVSWLVGLGLIVGGIVLGVGLMGWGWSARPTPDAVVTHTAENDILSHTPPLTLAQTPTANSSPPEHATPAAPPVVPPAPAVAKEEAKVLIVSPPASVQLENDTQTEPLQPQQIREEKVAGEPSDGRVTPPLPGVANTGPLSPHPTTTELSGSLPTRADEGGPVQRSPFVNTLEPERITSPPSPPVEQRVATKAKPTPTPRAPTKKELAARPPVESTPAPSEESDVAEADLSATQEEEATPSAAQEKEGEAETTSPPTPASVSFLQWSSEPEKRMAFIKVGSGPTTLAHEGDTVNGVKVVKIRQGAVELQSGESHWTLKAR